MAAKESKENGSGEGEGTEEARKQLCCKKRKPPQLYLER